MCGNGGRRDGEPVVEWMPSSSPLPAFGRHALAAYRILVFQASAGTRRNDLHSQFRGLIIARQLDLVNPIEEGKISNSLHFVQYPELPREAKVAPLPESLHSSHRTFSTASDADDFLSLHDSKMPLMISKDATAAAQLFACHPSHSRSCSDAWQCQATGREVLSHFVFGMMHQSVGLACI